LSSADDPHSAKAKAESAAAAATNYVRVTPEQMGAFLSNLGRRALIFARSAARQAQIWWQILREAIQSANTAFAERWSGLKARLQSSIESTRCPTLGSRLSGQLRVMPEAWRDPRAIKFWAKYLSVSIALGLVVLFGFALYSIATLPIGGGLQVEATQSALTYESAQGDVFATRGVFKGDKLTAADLPRIWPRRLSRSRIAGFINTTASIPGESCAPAGGILRRALPARAEAP
jgi:penicillin-binding protein 1A